MQESEVCLAHCQKSMMEPLDENVNYRKLLAIFTKNLFDRFLKIFEILLLLSIYLWYHLAFRISQFD